MKKIFLLIFVLFLFACPGKNPPPPPPVEVCGNGNCLGSETPETCPADCKDPDPEPICDLDKKCESERGESIDNCKDCKDVPPVCGDKDCSPGETPQSCPSDCKAPPKAQLDKKTLVCKGQYVQFVQPHNWAEYGDANYADGYNCDSQHIKSAWGMLVPKTNKQNYTSWLIDESVAASVSIKASIALKSSMASGDPDVHTRYRAEIENAKKPQSLKAKQPAAMAAASKGLKLWDLSKPNPQYEQHILSYLREVCGRNDQTCSLSFEDAYYLEKWLRYGAAKFHPYRDNKQGIDWGEDEYCMPESKPWFCTVSWNTEGDGFNEHVVSYQIIPKYKWFWDEKLVVARAIKTVRGEYPGMEPVRIRFVNENHARFDANGQHTGGFGGEDKLFQILRMEFEKIGLKHGRDFIIVNDWMPFQGTTFLEREWARAGQFDRNNRNRWMREVHGCNASQISKLRQMEAQFPLFADFDFTVISTDGFKPENSSYIKELNKLFKLKLPIFEAKVPSETAVANKKIYYDQDAMKTFRENREVMKRILQ